MKIIDFRKHDTLELDGPGVVIFLERDGSRVKVGVKAPPTTAIIHTRKTSDSALQTAAASAK